MLSIILPVRDTTQLAASCLSSLISTFARLCEPRDVEFILIDDNSDPSSGIVGLFEQFKRATSSPTTILKFKSRQYYTYACSSGFSLARGNLLLFVSHDMIVTPTYVSRLTAAAATREDCGIVRGCSNHVDCFAQHIVTPPLAIRSYADVCSFSEFVAEYHGTRTVDDGFLIGDSFLVKRAVIEKIGVMDTRYRHLFGDIDFGLRARRAGFKLVCAKGAWLYHEAHGHTKYQMAGGASELQMRTELAQLLVPSYNFFRDRWDTSLPAGYPGGPNIDFDRLVKLPARFDEFAPPVAVDSAVCEIVAG